MAVKRPTLAQLQAVACDLGMTGPSDATGHPALSLPCGLVDGLPVGAMLIGKHCDEATIYRAAHAFEQGADWRTL